MASVPDDSIGLAPLDEAPGLAPLDDAPGLAPLDEAPGLAPLDDTLGLMPVDETPGLVPVDEIPTLTPLDDELGLTPLEEAPSLEPLGDATGLAPLAHHPGLTPVEDDPLANAAGYESSAKPDPLGDNFGGLASSPTVNPYQSPALASPSYQHGQMGFSSGGRSGLVTAVGVVNFVMAGLQLMCGLLMLFMGGLMGYFASQMEQEVGSEAELVVGIATAVAVIYGIVSLVACALLVISGVGVLKRANWARVLTLILGGLCGLLAILSLVSIFTGQCGGVVGLLLHGGYCTFVYIVLLNRKCANEFG
jgi:hypothetical protein